MNERDTAWAAYSSGRVVTAVEVFGELYTFKAVWDAAWAAAMTVSGGNQASE